MTLWFWLSLGYFAAIILGSLVFLYLLIQKEKTKSPEQSTEDPEEDLSAPNSSDEE